MSTMVVIRPGATAYDEQQRIAGSLELAPLEHAQADVLKATCALPEMLISAVYSGPLDPSGSTARLLGEQFDLPVRVADGLRAVNLGLWEGQQVSEVQQKYPKTCRNWLNPEIDPCPPNGESVSQVIARLRKALDKPLRRDEAFFVVAGEPLASVLLCHFGGNTSRTPHWTLSMSQSEVDVVEFGCEHSSWLRSPFTKRRRPASPMGVVECSVRLPRQGKPQR